ncbi:MAG: biotin transporter BioY [Planctomycetes bacterium]|nr:biotin transporter BioY [Planctomycetota bacterium]
MVAYTNTGTALAQRTRVWAAALSVVGFALLTAAGAHLAVPLPGTPVPMTLQTLFVLLAGVTLGPRLGALSMLFYLLLGSTGYHVFALGNWGFTTIFGATGGYLLGFVLAQPVIGLLAKPDQKRWQRGFAAVVAGNAIIFGCGLIWLSLWMGTGLGQTLAFGLWPFIPGMLVKTALAGTLGGLVQPSVRRLLRG